MAEALLVVSFCSWLVDLLLLVILLRSRISATMAILWSTPIPWVIGSLVLSIVYGRELYVYPFLIVTYSLAYMALVLPSLIVSTAFINVSPTVVILNLASRDHGIDVEELRKRFLVRNLLDERRGSLENSGLVRQSGSGLVLSPTGRIVLVLVRLIDQVTKRSTNE